MTVDDLQYIFRNQLKQLKGDAKLWFMLLDGEHAIIEKHPASKMAALLPILSAFEYAGNEGNVPRFVKQ